MSKQKSKLAKLMTSDDKKIYETTEYACKMWFNILNKEVFDNKLTPVDEIDIRWRRLCHAFYEIEYKKENTRTKIGMSKKYKSKKFFVEVLAHELVHHYQALYNEPLGHGPSFVQWSDKFNRKGINLKAVY